MHHFAKTRTSYNSCSKHSLPCYMFSETTNNPQKLSICSK